MEAKSKVCAQQTQTALEVAYAAMFKGGYDS
jgi:hypothetical protein